MSLAHTCTSEARDKNTDTSSKDVVYVMHGFPTPVDELIRSTGSQFRKPGRTEYVRI